MKRITDEQAQKIANAVLEVYDEPNPCFDSRVRILATAAYEACRPLILAEALAEPTDTELHLMQVRTASPNYQEALCSFLANRLRALTEKPDAAVEAVMNMPELNGWSDTPKRSAAERIVAAVRAADKESQ